MIGSHDELFVPARVRRSLSVKTSLIGLVADASRERVHAVAVQLARQLDLSLDHQDQHPLLTGRARQETFFETCDDRSFSSPRRRLNIFKGPKNKRSRCGVTCCNGADSTALRSLSRCWTGAEAIRRLTSPQTKAAGCVPFLTLGPGHMIVAHTCNPTFS
jgi:hypothetical protein